MIVLQLARAMHPLLFYVVDNDGDNWCCAKSEVPKVRSATGKRQERDHYSVDRVSEYKPESKLLR